MNNGAVIIWFLLYTVCTAYVLYAEHVVMFFPTQASCSTRGANLLMFVLWKFPRVQSSHNVYDVVEVSFVSLGIKYRLGHLSRAADYSLLS